MYLINTKLDGRDVPAVLPNSLIPPSLREQYGSDSHEVLASQGSSSTTKDLFDLFDDPPPVAPPAPSGVRQTSAPQPPAPFQPTAFLPQPPSRRMTAQTTGQRQMSPGPPAQQPQSGFGMAALGERNLKTLVLTVISSFRSLYCR